RWLMVARDSLHVFSSPLIVKPRRRSVSLLMFSTDHSARWGNLGMPPVRFNSSDILGSGWGGEDAGEEVAVIGARLGPHPVVAPNRVGPGAQSAEPKDDLAPERPRHCEASMGVAD